MTQTQAIEQVGQTLPPVIALDDQSIHRSVGARTREPILKGGVVWDTCRIVMKGHPRRCHQAPTIAYGPLASTVVDRVDPWFRAERLGIDVDLAGPDLSTQPANLGHLGRIDVAESSYFHGLLLALPIGGDFALRIADHSVQVLQLKFQPRMRFAHVWILVCI